MDCWEHVHFFDCLQLIELLVFCKCVEARYWLDLSNWYLLSLWFVVDTVIWFHCEFSNYSDWNQHIQIIKSLFNWLIAGVGNQKPNSERTIDAAKSVYSTLQQQIDEWESWSFQANPLNSTLPAMRNAKVVMGWNPGFKLSWMQILHYSKFYMAKLHLKVHRAHVAILHQNFWKWTSGSCTTWTQSGCPLQRR